MVSPEATNFAGPYVDWLDWPAIPEIDERQTIEPPPFCSICSMAYLQVRNMPAAVDGHDLVPVLGRGFGDRAQWDDPGVRHEDVEAAVVLDRRLDHAPGVVGFRDVADDGRALGATRLEVRAKPVQPGSVDVGRDEAGAFGREQVRGRPADALGSAGDDGRLPREPAHLATWRTPPRGSRGSPSP